MENVELLAPAGSLDILKTAVHAGADAIYVGGPAFSARAGAKNFTYEEMQAGITYAHFYNRKVFVAINTLVRDDELKKLRRYIEELAAMAPDAVIVQDLGVAKVVRELLPELPLHASTQLTVSNRYGVQALKVLGFCRVVLARELTISEIADIVAAHPDIQIETFVHGAQCFSYSGQCLMSSLIGGRSGNRGQCAQPCRLPYQLDSKSGTLLSPKDMFGMPQLSELVNTGVHTLKIEGRLKNRDYVFYTVKAYREILNKLSQNTQPNNIAEAVDGLSKGIRQIFNREFSPGYLTGDLGAELISLDRHNNKGIPIGQIQAFNRKQRILTIWLEEHLSIGDGVYIESKEGDGFGFTVTDMIVNGMQTTEAKAGTKVELPLSEWEIKNKVAGKQTITKGDVIYKSFDKKLSQEIVESDQPPKIAIDFKLIAKAGQSPCLEYADEDNNKGEVTTDYTIEKAHKHPITEEAIAKQLQRLGNTEFILRELQTDVEPGVMLPSSVLNDLRRLAVDKCTVQRIDRTPYKFQDLQEISNNGLTDSYSETSINWGYEPALKYEPALIAKIGDPNIAGSVSKQYQRIYFVGTIENLKKAVQKAGAIPVYYVITAMVKEQQLEQARMQIKQAVNAGVTGFVVNQIGQRELILTIDPKISIVYDVGMNVFNKLAYRELMGTNPLAINLSVELNQQQLNEFRRLGEVYIHSRYRLMISEHSLLSESCKNSTASEKHNKRNKYEILVDRKGYNLPTIENEFGQVEIYNSQVTTLLQELAILKKHKHSGYIVDISRDFIEEAKQLRVIETYAEAFRIVFNDSKQTGASDAISDKLRNMHLQLTKEYGENITKGHWQRGVK
ncbi:U32 family peptidase [Desulfuribacillus alkaliarsenatis]|uniref:Peptidase U32 collagenase domain-containing protein n=1 Tax=Desulfuribacillus alkaliarsenatis TaxID=766136 RepID=A0A1E5FYH8_9FIRM|nr:U32 family peptidase [Desulfuribacillus alkaliarsenatis]OEF95625.1 hypothetical protein BHF68_12335 [Desulfuribacillus alkaliarsenatis]